MFLKPVHKNPNWSKGVPRYLIKELNALFVLIQRYLTRQGRYGDTFMYHITFLLHFIGKKQLNLHLFLLTSLSKMEKKVKTNPNKAKYRIFHQGLIKLLIMEKFQKKLEKFELLPVLK